MISLSFLLALSIACSKGVDSTEPVTPETDGSAVNKSLLLQLVNDTRKKGCQCGDTWYPPAPAITWNELLEKAAMNHSRDMYQKNYFSHTSPDGKNAGYRIQQVGYNWKSYGENIAMGYKSEREVVAGWISSPGHCKNIMNKNYREMGVARTGNYWTQAFGSK